MIGDYFIIGLGGFLGAVSRQALVLLIGQRWGRYFPSGTFIGSVSGSFCISPFMAVVIERFMVNL